MLVGEGGQVLYRREAQPGGEKLASYEPIVRLQRSGWMTYLDDVQAYAPIVLESRVGSVPVPASPR